MRTKVLKTAENLFKSELYTRENIEAGKKRNKKIIYCLKKILRKNKIKGKVLDAGCGDGSLTLAFRNAFKSQVFGVDIASTALKRARRKGIFVKTGDIEKKIPFPDDYFSMVLLTEVIEHVFDPDSVLQEVRRVLKGNGVLILTTPNLSAWYNRVLFLFGIQPFFLETSTLDKTIGLGIIRRFTANRQPLGHLRLFTKGALTDLLELHNFQVLKLATFPLFALPKPMLIVDRFISNISSLGSTFLIVAKKRNQ